MNVERALAVVPAAAVVTAETRANHFGSSWRIVARLPDGYERTLTQFASQDAFSAARWINRFEAAR